MKAGIEETIGKTISGVVTSQAAGFRGNESVFLLFSDGTYFELYGSEFTCAGGVDRGGLPEVRRYVENAKAELRMVFPRQ